MTLIRMVLWTTILSLLTSSTKRGVQENEKERETERDRQKKTQKYRDTGEKRHTEVHREDI